MHRTGRLGLCYWIAGVALVAVLAPGPPPAYSQVAAVNHLTVRKVVIGPVPSDRVFTVRVYCNDDAPTPPVSVLAQTIVFDSEGGQVTFDVPGPGSPDHVIDCTLEETAGVPTTPIQERPSGTGYGLDYSCAVTDPGVSIPPDGPNVGCGFDRTAVHPFFPGVRTGATLTVTVTNWFVEPVTTSLVEAGPPAPIVLDPVFTG